MNLDQFYPLFNGTKTNFDGVSGSQCVSLVNFYSRAIGGSRFTGEFAYMIYDQAGDFYEQIPNTPEGVPQRGDIVVWAADFNGGAGHTGIATGKGNTETFEVFEENDPLDAPAQLTEYNYAHVLGWLHPKVLPVTPVAIDTTALDTKIAEVSAELDQARVDRDTNWNAVISLTRVLGFEANPDDKEGTVNEGIEKVNEFNNEITNLNIKIGEAPAKIIELESRITELQNAPVAPAQEPLLEDLENRFPILKKLVQEIASIVHPAPQA